MITVMQLLAQPIFKNFQLAGENAGLWNGVTGTAIFEWETKADIEATFEQGEFVMTTLSGAREDISYAEEGLRALIDKKVAAIAVKTVYHNHLPQEIISYAGEKCVPIFFFSNTYMDDLIYDIKNALLTDEVNNTALKRVKNLLFSKESTNAPEMAKELNPFFFENFICCSILPKDWEHGKEVLEKFYSFYNSLSLSQFCKSDTSYILIKCNRSLLLVFSTSDKGHLRGRFNTFLESFEIREREFRIGISHEQYELSAISQGLWEAIFAATTCILDKETFLEFKSIGMNQILMPICKNKWVRQYYENFHQKLTLYDQKHNSNLQETLIQYIKCGGDVVLTADKLFQHGNTVRYRLGKIKDIMGIHDASDAYIQMYVYVRFHEIMSFFEGEEII